MLNDERIELSDDLYILEKLAELWKTKSIAEIINAVVRDKSLWDENLEQIPKLEESVALHTSSMLAGGVSQALNSILD